MLVDEKCRAKTAADAEINVDVWHWDLDAASADVRFLEGWLSSGERERAAAFVTSQLSGRWIAARAGMRAILAERLDVAPHSLVFDAGPHGRPYLSVPDCPYSFNLSHSDNIAVLAMSEAIVGVDVERVAQLPEGVAEAFFSAEENHALLALPEAERARAFYRCWTAKEAIVKALGAGMSIAGKSFTVSFTDPAEFKLLHADWTDQKEADWGLSGFETIPGFAGAVAVKGEGRVQLRHRTWNFTV